MAKLAAAQLTAITTERAVHVATLTSAQGRGDAPMAAAAQRRINDLDARVAMHTNDTNVEAGH